MEEGYDPRPLGVDFSVSLALRYFPNHRRRDLEAMGDEAIPADVRQFLARYIHSVAQLEVLLTLHANADQDWDAPRLARELSVDREAATMYLEDLSSRGLLTYDKTGTTTFRYGPTSELRATIDRLNESYAKRRVGIITLIFSKPVDDVRRFSNAFRLRKDE